MPIIVKHKKSNHHYILIGTSQSYYKDSMPSFFGGVLFPNEEEGEFKLAAICNDKGEIGWVPTAELIVVEVDKIKPMEILDKYVLVNDDSKLESFSEICPACGEKIKTSDKECLSCGLVFQDEENEDFI